MSQVFEYSNARISRVILKCLKHSNVRNIRIYESRMHESRIYTYVYKPRDSQVSQAFERSQRSNARVFKKPRDSRVSLNVRNARKSKAR